MGAGGTLCASTGPVSVCTVAIPLSKAQKPKLNLKDPTVGIDAQQMILSENTVIYRGEDVMPAQKSADATLRFSVTATHSFLTYLSLH